MLYLVTNLTTFYIHLQHGECSAQEVHHKVHDVSTQPEMTYGTLFFQPQEEVRVSSSQLICF